MSTTEDVKKIEQITLKAARINANLTQEEVCAKMDIKVETLRSWENNKTEPRISQAYKLADLYGVHIDNIIFFY